MDFWDLTKLLVRRWRVSLPMFLVAIGLTVGTYLIVKPDYVALSYVQLVPPSSGTRVGQPGPELRNPWLNQGVQTLGNAAVISIIDQSLRDELHATGFSDSYTVEMYGSSTMVTIEVVGDTKVQANDTATLLVERFAQSVSNLQTAYGVAPADLITTRRLDPGANADSANSNVKRAIIAVAAASMLLSTAITVAIDAMLRRRARRRGQPSGNAPQGRAKVSPTGSGSAVAEVPPQSVLSDHARAPLTLVYKSATSTTHPGPVTTETTQLASPARDDATTAFPKINGTDVPHPVERRSAE